MLDILKTESPALIAIFLCAIFIKGVVELILKLREKQDMASEEAVKELTKATDRNTYALEQLDKRLKDVEKTYSELPKLKIDMRKFFAAVKAISGARWSEIKKEMEDISDL